MNLDSAVAAPGDRLAAASGSTYNWFLPDLHGSVAGSLSADQSTVTSATRYHAWGDTIVPNRRRRMDPVLQCAPPRAGHGPV